MVHSDTLLETAAREGCQDGRHAPSICSATGYGCYWGRFAAERMGNVQSSPEGANAEDFFTSFFFLNEFRDLLH